MRIEIHISGPGVDDRRQLAHGQPELVLGRDADCHICLPDPRRNVSRRHLSVWCVDGELHFRVLSVVNGVELPFGEAPPGAQGVLPHGQLLKLGDYRVLSATALPAQEEDPWAVLEREAPGFGATGSPSTPRAVSQPASLGAEVEDDPFGEWGFDSTFGPDARANNPTATQAGAADSGIAAFFEGLGLNPQQLGPLGSGELSDMGKLVRMALLGLVQLHAARAGLKRELRAEDRTMLAQEDNNPLKAELTDEMRLTYLLGGRNASVGFIKPELALAELLAELRAHDGAMGMALRAAVEGTVRELSPASIRKSLGSSSRLFESARLWEAYAKLHEDQAADMAQWLDRLLGKYFTAAYLRESQRLKREPGPRSG